MSIEISNWPWVGECWVVTTTGTKYPCRNNVKHLVRCERSKQANVLQTYELGIVYEITFQESWHKPPRAILVLDQIRASKFIK